MTAVRHSTQTIALARRLRDGGWSLRQICDLIEREVGHRPARSTVYCWLNEDFAEHRRRERRRQKTQERVARSTGTMRSNHKTIEFKMLRMRVLRDAGISIAAVARVMTLDFPETPLTRSEVEQALLLDRPPRSWRASS